MMMGTSQMQVKFFLSRNYSGNKDSLGLNVGVALTFNIPLDKRFQDDLFKKCYNTRKNTKTNIV